MDANIPLRRDGSREWIQRFLQDLLVLPGRLCEIVFQQGLGPARSSLSNSLARWTARLKGSQLVTASMRTASSSGVHLEFSFSRLSPKVVDIDRGVYKQEGDDRRAMGLKVEWGNQSRGRAVYICGIRSIRDGEEYRPRRAINRSREQCLLLQ